MAVKSSDLFLPKDTSSTRTKQVIAGVAVLLDSSIDNAVRPAFTSMVSASGMMDISPSKSSSCSVSLDESMSPFDSLRSSELVYIDNDDTVSVRSIETKTNSILKISDYSKKAGPLNEG